MSVCESYPEGLHSQRPLGAFIRDLSPGLPSPVPGKEAVMKGGGSLRNEYLDSCPMLDKTPKAVIAAVVVSLLSSGGDEFDQVAWRFLSEWRTLHDNGIVPQRPPREPYIR
jgi:hypothetical protein